MIEWNWILEGFSARSRTERKAAAKTEYNNGRRPETKEIDHMLDELIKRYPILERVREDIEAVYGILERCYENGGKLLMRRKRRKRG